MNPPYPRSKSLLSALLLLLFSLGSLVSAIALKQSLRQMGHADDKPATPARPGPVFTPPPDQTATPPQPADTLLQEDGDLSHWQIYTDETNKFSLMYPPGWHIQPPDPEEVSRCPLCARPTVSVSFVSPEYVEKEDPDAFIDPIVVVQGAKLTVFANQNPNFHSYDEYVRFLDDSPSGQTKEYATRDELVLDGSRCLLLLNRRGGPNEGPRPNGYFESDCYLWRNGLIFDLYLMSAEAQDTLFRKILSNLRFR